MANSWGTSWGDSWAESWGLAGASNKLKGTAYGTSTVSATLTTESVPEENQGGAGEGRKLRVYIERDGKILLFPNASQAAAYITAEKEAEKASTVAEKTQVATYKPKSKPKKRIKAPEPQVITIDVLETLLSRFQVVEDLTDLIKQHEWEALISLQTRMLELEREEDDIELLLLAA